MLENRYGPLLALVIASVVTQSLFDTSTSTIGGAITHAVGGASLLLAVRAANVSHRWRRAADSLVVVVLVLNVITQLLAGFAGTGPERGAEPLWVIAVILVPVTVARRLAESPVVTVETLMGAVAAYLQIAVAYAFVFQALDVLGPTPLFGTEVSTTSYMYASLETISTLGYGDLVPVTDLGRLVAMSEAVTGQIFLVTLVALLVSRFAVRPPTSDSSPPDGPA